MINRRSFVCVIPLILLFAAVNLGAQAIEKRPPMEDGRERDVETPLWRKIDPGVIPTNQTITPAGVQSVFERQVFGIAFGSSSNEIYVATSLGAQGQFNQTRHYRLDWRANKVLAVAGRPHRASGLQGLDYDEVSKTAFITELDDEGRTWLSEWRGGSQLTTIPLGNRGISQVAIASARVAAPRYAVAALTFDNAAAVVDADSGRVIARVRTGIAPRAVVIDAGTHTAWVSNWGGRFPHAGDRTSKAGPDPAAGTIVVDARGIAASGTVSRIDLKTGTVLAQIEVGLHPAALALDDQRGRLYVANSNSDTISVIDTNTNAAVESIPVQPFTRTIAGITPESLALSRDGQHLYVACAGINAVAAMSLQAGHMTMYGLIPTGWYPDQVVLSPDEKYLGVATLLGVGSGWKNLINGWCPNGPAPQCKTVNSPQGAIYVVPIPGRSQIRQFSAAVAGDTHLELRDTLSRQQNKEAKPSDVSSVLGAASPIQHVVYIIKENKTYDQLFGGIKEGNGDASLEEYSEGVIPNQWKLAREFVLFDNFYAMDGASSNGHQWVTQANETDYTYLGGHLGRSASFNGDDPMAASRGGFLWNAAAEAGKSIADFGEYAGNLQEIGRAVEDKSAIGFNYLIPKENRRALLKDYLNGASFEGIFSTTAPNDSVNRFLVKDYPAYTLGVPDVVRAQIFTNHLKQWEEAGAMPNLVLVQLPSDHTGGTTPGFSTPAACVADNDYALGRIVEAISHSTFWESTLVLVVQDDAQSGVDHVDAHRSVALAISPYIRRGYVDSTFYALPSIVKTIEMTLGLKNLSIFDLIANDLRNSFQQTPDFTPFTATLPRQPLDAVNPPLYSLSGQARKDAVASLKMNFALPDAAPPEKLGQILWRNAHRRGTQYPRFTHAAFLPTSVGFGNDDDDRQGKRSGGERTK